MPVPTNPDLPSSWEIPGVYFAVDLSGQAGSIGSVDKRLLLIANRLSTGTQLPDTPVLINGQSDANTFFGRGSDLARMAGAALAQVGSGVIDIYCLPIAEPAAGTQATHLITVTGPATSAGTVDVYVCGYRASIAIANTDTASAIADNIRGALAAILDLPATADAAGSGATITITARHRGLVGNDLPIRIDQTGATGVTFSPGTLTVAGASNGIAGSIILRVSTSAPTATIGAGDAPAAVAASLNTAINAGSFPVTSTVVGAVVTLLYASGRYVHRISTSITGGTTITSSVAIGVVATGAPTLTTALTNLAGLTAFGMWATSFNDTTTLGTISTHVETQANGRNQKGQNVHVGSTDTLVNAGAIPTGTTPLLTASPRYAVDWCPESPQQAYELAARTAAMIVNQDYAPKNYDGAKLQTNAQVPLLLPARAIRPGLDDQNTAIHTYFMTPLVVDEIAGQLAVVSGKTTSSSSDATLHDWGVIRHIDFLRTQFSRTLTGIFKGKNLRRSGTPHTVNTATAQDIADQALVLAKALDAIDLYDGAEAFKAGFQATVDPVVPGRVNCFIPMAVVRSLHQISIVGSPV